MLSKVVADLLGHSDVSVVLNTYSHVMPELKEQAIARLDMLLKKGRPKRADRPRKIRWVRRWPTDGKGKAPDREPEK